MQQRPDIMSATCRPTGRPKRSTLDEIDCATAEVHDLWFELQNAAGQKLVGSGALDPWANVSPRSHARSVAAASCRRRAPPPSPRVGRASVVHSAASYVYVCM
eukprot:GHVU01093963.1.p3 GENE.GHVU01093963.1~~GHVU01093963.1.p3  ORF type:complete len:103 (-),score=7.37 GHVU01093963.1:215-523(-)